MSEDHSTKSAGHSFPLSPPYFMDDCDLPAHYSFQPPVPREFDACPFSDDSGLFFQLAVTKYQKEIDLLENSFQLPAYLPSAALDSFPDPASDESEDLLDSAPPTPLEATGRHKTISKARTPDSQGSQAKIKLRGCGCQTSNCLRRYCKCFSGRGYCTEGCGCVDCFNTAEYEEERQLVIRKTEEICRASFAPKVLQTDSGAWINAEGCRCKSGCKSKHCLCSKNGVGCSPICKCSSCDNHRVDLEPAEVRKYFRNALRTKEKIMITSSPMGSREDKRTEIVSPCTAKKTTVIFFAKADAETRISASPANFPAS